MKKLLRWPAFMALLMLLTISTNGCGVDSPTEPEKPTPVEPKPDEPHDNPQDPPLGELPVPGLSFKSLTFSNEGETFACIIHGLKDGEWSAESNMSWCGVTVASDVLKIEVSANTESDERIAKISLYHNDGRLMSTIDVKQCATNIGEKLENHTSTKQSYYPVFTATWCPFCPDMEHTLSEIRRRLNRPIQAMEIHITHSELYRPISDALSEQYQNEFVPVGYFENYFGVDNMADYNVSIDRFWNTILWKTNSSEGYTDKCSAIACKASLSDNAIEADVTLKPVFDGVYRLLLFILEDNVIKPQTTRADVIPDYCHNNVLVGSLTSIEGQELEMTKSEKTISFIGDVPSDVNLSNLRLLVVLERNDSKLNFSNDCWYADNCLSVDLGKSGVAGGVETIYIGEDIQN